MTKFYYTVTKQQQAEKLTHISQPGSENAAPTGNKSWKIHEFCK